MKQLYSALLLASGLAFTACGDKESDAAKPANPKVAVTVRYVSGQFASGRPVPRFVLSSAPRVVSTADARLLATGPVTGGTGGVLDQASYERTVFGTGRVYVTVVYPNTTPSTAPAATDKAVVELLLDGVSKGTVTMDAAAYGNAGNRWTDNQGTHVGAELSAPLP